MLMVKATGVREDSVQTTLHMETILLLNAERFGTQREVIADGLPSHIAFLSGFLVNSAGNDSFVQLIHLPLGDRGSCGISPLQMPCTARIICGFQNSSPDRSVVSKEVPSW